MEGTLFKYHPQRRSLVAFCTGPGPQYFIFIGGLTDGFLACDYLPPLAQAIRGIGWTFIQPLLSSSYTGYGIGSLRQDCEELDALIEHLSGAHASSGTDATIVMMGHSTGCQDTVWYLRHGKHRHRVVKAILQAPVSDRDFMDTLAETAELRSQAASMIASGNGDELMPWRRDRDGVPITAYRFYSLAGRLADDDMFSWDLTPTELSAVVGHIAIPLLIVYSTDDEYVPPHVDKHELARRLQAAIPSSTLALIAGDHALFGKATDLVAAVVAFLNPTVR